MFKSFFKILFFVIVLNILIMAIALVAAPYFVRQDQVKAFIEKNVSLPDEKKIKLPSEIKFGLFPYMHFETEKVQIVGDKIPTQTFESVKFGFDFNDIWGNSIDFDIRTKYQGVSYDANIDIRDYKSFYENGKTPIVIDAVKPVPFGLKGDLEIFEAKRSLKNFTLTHKKTSARGNLNHEILKDGENTKIDGNLTIDTDNIDDLRRLAKFEQYNDKFNLVDGSGKLVFGFSTKGSDSYTFQKNLNSEGSFKFNDIKVNGFDLEEIARNPLEIKFIEDYSRNIPIDKADGMFEINNGLMQLSNVNANSNRFVMDTKGLVNIPDQEMNLDVDLDLNLASKDVMVPLKVKGTFEKPKIIPRYNDAIVNNLPAILEKNGVNIKNLDAEKIGNELLKGGNSKEIKENLKNLFKF